MLEFLLERIKEPSTWRGIAILLGLAGYTFSPEQQEAFIVAGLAVAGFIGALSPDKPERKHDDPIELFDLLDETESAGRLESETVDRSKGNFGGTD